MKFLIVVFSLLSSLLLSQEIKLSKDFKISKNDLSYKLFDSSELNVFYKFVSTDKDNPTRKTAESVCILQIGKQNSKFADVERLKLDSLYQQFSQQGHAGTKEFNLLLSHKPVWSGIVIKKFKNDTLIRQNFISSNICQYEDIPSALNWQLINETKEILGYKCRKAIGKYRGRLYTAWYAEKLPINDGPFVFRGLPGLILEIVDTDQYIHFKAEAINKNPMVVFLEDSHSIIKTSREKCRKFQENYFYNPGAFTQGRAYNVDGTVFIPRLTTNKKYNPVELE